MAGLGRLHSLHTWRALLLLSGFLAFLYMLRHEAITSRKDQMAHEADKRLRHLGISRASDELRQAHTVKPPAKLSSRTAARRVKVETPAPRAHVPVHALNAGEHAHLRRGEPMVGPWGCYVV
eukprot:CAMPEP_0198682272 /NCGR_PEP_ID=MMETSP1468-20131203/8401_1 /TAXON_ID=1461545 /ORGANISM="Mantoniella sp, Strain CCMP1436" /LENGTH=121 /DNA_ID=CAMNT_0044425023 /DNA_START=48 /DNA_END=414 /DNA_ORIENTATION=-